MQENNEKRNTIGSGQKVENPFQFLHIFEDNSLNEICDEIFDIVKKNTTEPPILCGSVAKMFSGILPEDYQPKDIDFYVSDWNFRQLVNKFPKEINGIVMIEKRPERFILHGKICVEIWSNMEREENENFGITYKNNLIPYKNYGNKIKK